jgi:hypothetical protein
MQNHWHFLWDGSEKEIVINTKRTDTTADIAFVLLKVGKILL